MAARRLLATLVGAGAVATVLSIAAGGQPQAPAGQDPNLANTVTLEEPLDLWFVELSSPPAVEGTSLSQLKGEKAAFRAAASKAGVRFTERYAFDRLWNGLSIKIDPGQVGRLSQVAGVKAIYPVMRVEAPEPGIPDPEPQLYTALAMTGADIAQTQLGFTGKGVKVGIIDSGVDIDHPDLGGSGTTGGTAFPTSRIVAGHDFVGDDFGSGPAPVEDANPDDCNGHGTHVAGIVGANGSLFKGVAPEVTFGAYRVFGCAGATTTDIMIAAMERAYADGMQIVNMSIGSTYQWPEYPSAAAATRLANKGVIVVASIGNDGEKALAAAGAPGVGDKVIGVASFDNSHARLAYFTVDGAKYGYLPATGAPAPPTAGTATLVRTGTPTSAADGCTATGGVSSALAAGNVVLIRRGTCGFYEKAKNAETAGAIGVVLYNNAAGFINPTVAPTPASAPPVGIPVVAITAADGVTLNNLIAIAPVTMTWTDLRDSFPNSAGNLISSFSSYGLSPDLSLKPDLGAPGGSISSTYPLEQGGYAILSGTSMSSPHVAGAAALYLQAHPNTSPQAMRAILQNTAVPRAWSGNPASGLRDLASRQGAGMIQIAEAILATVQIDPGKLSLGESQAGPQVRMLTLKNGGASAVTYDLSAINAVSSVNTTNTQTFTSGTFYTQAFFLGTASVVFGAPSVTVAAGGTATVTATITPAGAPDKGHYGGYLVFTPQGGGTILRVPFGGFVGDYQSIQVLKPLTAAFPWLARRTAANTYTRQDPGAVFTMAAGDIPYIAAHFDYQSRLVRVEVFDAVSGKAWHRSFQAEYFGRNSATGIFVLGFDGVTRSGNRTYTVPNGSYVMKLSVLKALGDPANPADWEICTSPMFQISR